jgi:hypothetical protein
VRGSAAGYDPGEAASSRVRQDDTGAAGVCQDDDVGAAGVCQDDDVGAAGVCQDDDVGAAGEARHDEGSSVVLCQRGRSSGTARDGPGSAGCRHDGVSSAGARQEDPGSADVCHVGGVSVGCRQDGVSSTGVRHEGVESAGVRHDGVSSTGARHDPVVSPALCQDVVGLPGSVVGCHGGVGSGGGACQGGFGSGCCHPPAVVPGAADHGWSSFVGVGHAVPEMAGRRVGGSTGGRTSSELPPVCHASVVDRQPLVPVLERHSVVCRHRDSDVERHSDVAERQPTPSGGNAGRPVVATSDHRPVGPSRAPLCSTADEGRCDHASARSAHVTASGMGSMLPVSVTDPQPGWSDSGPERHRETVDEDEAAGSDEYGPSGTFPGGLESGVRRSRGSLAP